MIRNIKSAISNSIYDKISEIILMTNEYDFQNTAKVLEEARLMALLEACQPTEDIDDSKVE